MGKSVKLLSKISSETVQLTFSLNISRFVIDLMNNFSPYFIEKIQYDFYTNWFAAELKFDNKQICDIFCRFYNQEK